MKCRINGTNSSSEEDGVLPNTSDDSMENATNVQNLVPLLRQEEKRHKELNVGHVNNSHANNEQILYQQFLDCRLWEQHEVLRQKDQRSNRGDREQRNQLMTVKEKMKQMVQQAESAKVKIFDIWGRHEYMKYYKNQKEQNMLLHSVVADDDYAIVAVHVDKSLNRCIIEGDYIDFSWLIPRDRVSLGADKRLEIVTKNGQMYFQPIVECEGIGINNIYKWDQAFQVFCMIYTKGHAHHATEMLQYSHIIQFIWEKVYAYEWIFISIWQNIQTEVRISYYNRHGQWGCKIEYLKQAVVDSVESSTMIITRIWLIKAVEGKRSVGITISVIAHMVLGVNLITAVESVGNWAMACTYAER